MSLDQNAVAAALAQENGTAGPFPGVSNNNPPAPQSNFNSASNTQYDNLINQLQTDRSALQSLLNSTDFSQADAVIQQGLSLKTVSQGISAVYGQHQVRTGTSGNDNIDLSRQNGYQGYNVVSSGSGSDVVKLSSHDLGIGGDNDDVIFAPWSSSGHDAILLDKGNDLATALGSGNNILAGEGNDYVDVSGSSGGNYLSGGKGEDVLKTSTGDIAFGGDNNDDIYAGAGGGNLLIGDKGNDQFFLAQGQLPSSQNRIADFKSGDDKLIIKNVVGINSFSDLTLVQQGSNTLVKFGSTSIVLLEGVTPNNVHASDFYIVPGGNADVTPPTITAALSVDNGHSTTDGVSTNPAFSGTVSDQSPITSFRAGLDATQAANFTDVTNKLVNGSFVLDQATMNLLAGGTLAAGAHTLHLQATDQFNNTSAVANFNFTFVIDNNAPTISVALTNDTGISSSDLRTNDPRVSGQVTDANQVSIVKASLNNANASSFVDITGQLAANGTFTLSPATLQTLNGGLPLTAGQQTLRIQATDEFGNVSSVNTFSYNYVIDNSAPSIAVGLLHDTGASATDLKTTDPAIAGQVTDSNAVTSFKASLNNSNLASLVDITSLLGAGGTYTIDSSTLQALNGGQPLTAGQQTLRLQATDEFGNVSAINTFSFNYVVDNSAPTISQALVNDNGASATDLKTTDPTVAGQVTDANTVTSFKASLNNSNPASFVDITNLLGAGGNYTLSPSTLQTLNGGLALTPGVQTLRLQATDEFGNVSATNTFTFNYIVDITGPSVQVGLANDTGTVGDNVSSDATITGQVTDQNAVVSVLASVNNQNPLSFSNITAQLQPDGSFTLTPSFLQQLNGGTAVSGNTTLYLKATDEFGNFTDTSFTFTVQATDTTPPNLTASLLHDTGRSSQDNVSVDPSIKGTVTDDQQFSRLLAGVDGMTPANFVDVSSHVGTNGSYVLDQQTLESVFGAPLSRGLHTVHLLAEDAAGNTTPLDFTFNFNRPFVVYPGAKFDLDLKTFFPGSSNTTLFTVDTSSELPTGEMKLNGILQVAPTVNDYGRYEFTVAARNGDTVTTQEFAVDVNHDPDTSTRVTGRLVDLELDPIPGVDVEFNGQHAFSDANGDFTLTVSGPITSDTIIFHAITLIEEGQPETYAFLAQKINVLLGHEVWEGVNNVISRTEYLPRLDVANGQTIDPNQDTVLTTAAIPGVSLEFGNHTLLNADGSGYYDGLLTITEMPVDQMPISRPANLFPDLVIAVQPEKLTFTTPAKVTMPDRTGYDEGTNFDLYAIDPISGEFSKVGEGVKSADGFIHTTSGGISTTDWAFFVPLQTGKGSDPNANQHNADNTCECPVKAVQKAHSEVDSFSGNYSTDVELPGYSSLGQVRSNILTYNSLLANPQQLYFAPFENATFGVTGNKDDRLVAQVSVGNGKFNWNMPGFIDANGTDTGMRFWRIHSTNGQGSIMLDMRDLPTGYYDLKLRDGIVRANSNGISSGTTQLFTDKILNINFVDSIFGRGWGLTGLKQLVENSDGSVLIVDGDGSKMLFNKAQDGSYLPPDPIVNDLVKTQNGGFTMTTPEQTIYSFNADGKLLSVTDSNANSTTYNYDSNGNLTSVVDPATLCVNVV